MCVTVAQRAAITPRKIVAVDGTRITCSSNNVHFANTLASYVVAVVIH